MFNQQSSADLMGDEAYITWRQAHPEVVEAENRRIDEARAARMKAAAEYEATRLPDGDYPLPKGGFVLVDEDNLYYHEGDNAHNIEWVGWNKAGLTPADLPAVVQDYFANCE